MYVDKLGRKPILVSGAIGMATCHMIIAVITAKNQDQWATHSAAGWAAVSMVWLFVVFFGKLIDSMRLLRTSRVLIVSSLQATAGDHVHGSW